MIRGFWHDGAKNFFSYVIKNFAPPQEICELALLILKTCVLSLERKFGKEDEFWASQNREGVNSRVVKRYLKR